MSEIRFQTVETNGISMRVAECGEGPLVVLCHGFPESWYSWRHQLAALAEAGYHAVAPDQRGYGETDAPEPIEAYDILHLVGDIVGLVYALGEQEAVIVGHDWGSPVAWNSALMRPDVFRAVASLSVPVGPRGSNAPMQAMRANFGDRFFYQIYFQTPGVAEHELQHDVAETMRKMLFGASGSLPRQRGVAFQAAGAPPATSYMLERMPDPGDDLPSWLTKEDLDYFVAAFTKTGFRGGLNWYRNIDRNWELTAAFQNKRIEQPALFVTGERDVVPYNEQMLPFMKQTVPNLRDPKILDGIGHWTQQEASEDVNSALIDFLNQL